MVDRGLGRGMEEYNDTEMKQPGRQGLEAVGVDSEGGKQPGPLADGKDD